MQGIAGEVFQREKIDISFTSLYVSLCQFLFSFTQLIQKIGRVSQNKLREPQRNYWPIINKRLILNKIQHHDF